MLSASPYAYLNGFNIERDFVELPSQLMENRVDEKESLWLIAQHYKTWERMPEEILDKLEKLRTFMQWYWVSRQNELALVDNYLYTHEVPEDISILDKNILDTVNTYSYFKRGEEYKMYCAFLHIFWWGYEAKYYSYMWAETYAADLFSKIKEAWMFNKEIGLAYRDIVLAAWSEKAAKEIFRDFMWREVSLDALMKQYWLDGE